MFESCVMITVRTQNENILLSIMINAEINIDCRYMNTDKPCKQIL